MSDESKDARAFTIEEILARDVLATEVRKALVSADWVASGSAYYDGVNDALMLLRGADPQQLKLLNVEKRKARLGW